MIPNVVFSLSATFMACSISSCTIPTSFPSCLLNSFTSNLLEKASYDPKSDVLIHVGDVMTKASRKQSLKMLAYLASNNITGVRGNHDQAVIEWRGWISWIRSLPGGARWLNRVYLKWREEKCRGTKLNLWLHQEKQRDSSPWWNKIPKDWKLFSEHFNIAHDMTDEQYDYLRSLPLTLYVPSAHAFIVHAGLLPSNPNHRFNHPTQPLARIPSLPSRNSTLSRNDTYPLLRGLQELRVLNDVPQNTVPWNVLNMRSIHNGKISRQVANSFLLSVYCYICSLGVPMVNSGRMSGTMTCLDVMGLIFMPRTWPWTRYIAIPPPLSTDTLHHAAST